MVVSRRVFHDIVRFLSGVDGVLEIAKFGVRTGERRESVGMTIRQLHNGLRAFKR